jgi:hypothetical protein
LARLHFNSLRPPPSGWEATPSFPQPDCVNIDLIVAGQGHTVPRLQWRAIDRLDRENRTVNDAEPPLTELRLDVKSWLLRLFTWDGVLPVCIVLIPSVIGLIIPNRRGAIEMSSVIVPIAAFLIRFRAGKRHIESNNCGEIMKIFQLCVFSIAILALVLVDAFIMLSHVMPRRGKFVTIDDLLALLIPIAFYLSLMAFAMYPGRRCVQTVD